MEQFFQDNRTYVNACTAGTVAPKPADTTNFTYDCPTRTATAYTITATGQGGLAGYLYSIDQSNVRSTVAAARPGPATHLLGAEEGRIVLTAMQQRGFTIVELLIGLTLLGVLLGLGVPAMGTYLQNSKLASAAASYFSGVQTARAEAIRRNVRTEFVLTDTPISTADIANCDARGQRPQLGRVRPRRRLRAGDRAKAAAEGEASSAAQAVQVAGSAAAPAVFTGRIPFNGFGGTADGAAYQISITNPAAGTCAPTGKVRCRRITVSPGGQIMACDPAAPAGDSRAC